MESIEQGGYLKKVQNKFRTAQHRIDEYQDFLLEVKRFVDVREDRYDDIRDLELLADNLLKTLYNFEENIDWFN
jgi:hypothetical protein